MSDEFLVLFVEESQREFKLANSRLRIGRAPGNDIQLSDQKVSSRHCVVMRGVLTDSGSTNGTVINDEKIICNVKQTLKAGDHILLGDSHLYVRVKVQAKKAAPRPLIDPPAAQEEEEVLRYSYGGNESDSSSSGSEFEEGVVLPGEAPSVVSDNAHNDEAELDGLDWMTDYNSRDPGQTSAFTRKMPQEVKKKTKADKLKADLWEVHRDLTRAQNANLTLERKIKSQSKTRSLKGRKQMNAIRDQLITVKEQLEFGAVHKRKRIQTLLRQHKELQAQLTDPGWAIVAGQLKANEAALKRSQENTRKLQASVEQLQAARAAEERHEAQLEDRIVRASIELGKAQGIADQSAITSNKGAGSAEAEAQLSALAASLSQIKGRLQRDSIIFLAVACVVLSLLVQRS